MIRPALPDEAPILKGLLLENNLGIDGLTYERFSQPCLVYVREGEVVGFIQAIPAEPYAIITECAVARAHHGKGYGVRLLEHMETVLRMYGCGAVATFTGEKNPVKEQLEGCGMRTTGYGAALVKAL